MLHRKVDRWLLGLDVTIPLALVFLVCLVITFVPFHTTMAWGQSKSMANVKAPNIPCA
jgi:hypothetical protein